MALNDRDTTVDELRECVIDFVKERGWGNDGIQNPQHVAMAMTVEMSELLEHFQWMEKDEVDALLAGKDEQRVREIAEEFADVMMYGLQLTKTLKIDITGEMLRKMEIVRNRINGPYRSVKQAKEKALAEAAKNAENDSCT